MIDATDIDELPEEIDAEVLADVDDKPVKPRRFVGYKTLGLATIIAALLGAGGGGVLSQFTAPSAPSLSPLKAQIKTATADNKALKAQVDRLQEDMKKQGAKKPKSALKTDLSAIESRLTELETAEPQIIEATTPIDSDIISRLEALQSEGSDALDLSDILARLDKLETKSAAKTILSKIDRKALLTDLKSALADENMNAGKTAAPAKSGPLLDVLLNKNIPDVLLDFPKADVLDALSEADQSGWLKRTINKRITVQSEDNPRYLVQLIETDLEAGHISDALMKFDKLPETAKAAAKDWRDAFKDNK